MNYDTWYHNSPLEFKKKLLGDFIKNTLEYAHSHVNERKKEIPPLVEPELEDKINRLLKWISYIEFQEHTLNELGGTKLDHYLD